MHRTITYYLDDNVEHVLTNRPTLNDREVEIIPSESTSTKLSFFGVDPTDDDPRQSKVVVDGSFSYSTSSPLTANDLNSAGYITGWKVYYVVNEKDYLVWSIDYSERLPSTQDIDVALVEFQADEDIICLAPTAQNDVVYGYGGNDRITPSKGNDYVNGGDGVDTLVLSGRYSEYTVSWNYDRCTVRDLNSSRDGTDLAVNIERIEFSDRSLAYDMDGNAGTVAKILGAVFGADSVNNESYVGIGLELIDAGMSYESLIDLALEVRLGKGYTLSQEVSLLENNVYGMAATPNVQSFWAARGDSAATVAINYAECDVNIDNIDLVGLTQTGLEYI